MTLAALTWTCTFQDTQPLEASPIKLQCGGGAVGGAGTIPGGSTSHRGGSGRGGVGGGRASTYQTTPRSYIKPLSGLLPLCPPAAPGGAAPAPKPTRQGQLPYGQRSAVPPHIDTIKAVFGADMKRVQGVTPLQGGGGYRARWLDKKGQIYEFDYQHNALEKYTANGKTHLGEFDATTGRQIKPGDPSRKVKK